MRKLSRFSVMLLLIVALAVPVGMVTARNSQPADPALIWQDGFEYDPAQARIRVAHFSADTPAVDVYIDRELSAIQGLEFGQVTDWIQVPAGVYNVAVAPAGTSLEAAAIGPVNYQLGAGTWTTVAAIGSLANNTLTAQVNREDYSELDAANARVSVFHAIPDAPAVDVILADGTVLVPELSYATGLTFNSGLATLDVPAGTYDIQVVAAGTTEPAVLDLSGTELMGGKHYFVAAIGSLAEPNVALSATDMPAALLIGEPPADEETGDDMAMEEDEGPTMSILEIASSTDDFSTLVAAVDAAELIPALSGDGPFTVFAPTNDAFAAALDALGLTAEELLADTETLTDILLYHVVSGEVLAEQVVTLDSATTLLGSDITIEVIDGAVVLNGGQATVTTTDIMATNGVIHVIDGVILPPDFMLPTEEDMGDDMAAEEDEAADDEAAEGENGSVATATILDIATNTEGFSTLAAAVTAAGLGEALAGEGPLTVFAPTNDAFAAALDALDLTAEELLADPDTLTSILLYHVVSGEVTAEQVVTLESATTLQGNDIAIEVVDGAVVLNGGQATVTATDIVASNGVVHIIDGILLPPDFMMPADEETGDDMAMEEDEGPTMSILEIASSTDDFSTLVAAVDAAELIPALSGDGPFTVFAPTNDAFAAALDALGLTAEELLADTETLTDILLYHVVSGEVLAEQVVTLESATTLLGSDITIEVIDGAVVLNGGQATVTTTDIMATNGVIHVIDGVILPPAE